MTEEDLENLNGPDVERELRSSLREYEVLLEKHATEQELQDCLATIKLLQRRRDEDFPYMVRDAGIRERIDKTAAWAAMRREYQLALSSIPPTTGIKQFDSVILEERYFTEKAIANLDELLRSKGVRLDPEPDPAAKVAAAWQAKKNAVLRLEREREEELKNSPESMHATIRRFYGKAIDAIMEED